MWDYPRPPRIERTADRVLVEHAGVVVADSTRALRVLETSQPPTIYVPATDVDLSRLVPAEGHSTCEWKGVASYFDVVVGERVAASAAWTYPEPLPAFAALADHLSFYPRRLDRCSLGGEVVRPNEGDFYGGWITSKVVGPFKGGPGSWGW